MSKRAWLGAIGVLAILLPGSGGPAGATVPVEITIINRASGLPGDRVTDVYADDDGIWVGTVGGGVAQLAPSGRLVRVHGTKDGLPSASVVSIASFGGKIFVGTDAGLGIHDGHGWERLETAASVRFRNVFLRAQPDGQRLWAGAVSISGGLLAFDGTEWRFMGGQGRGLLNNVQRFAFRDGTVFLGTTNSGVYRRTDTDFAFYTRKDGLPSANILSLEMFSGTVWAGTSAGAARLDGTRWTAFTSSGGFPLSAVFALAASPGALYLGGREGLIRYEGGRFEALPVEEGQPGPGTVYALAWRDGTLYAGTARGLLVIRGW